MADIEDHEYCDEDFDDGENLPADIYVKRLQKGCYTNLYPTTDDELEREAQMLIDFQTINKDPYDG